MFILYSNMHYDCHVAYGIFVPQSGIKYGPTAVKAGNLKPLNHQGSPTITFLKFYLFIFSFF